MESFILIVMLISPPQNFGGGLSQEVALQEFTSKKSCIVAKDVIVSHYDEEYRRLFRQHERSVDIVRGVCVPK